VGLSLSIGRGHRSNRFGKSVRPVLSKNPQNTFETKTAPKRLKNLSYFEQEKPKHDRDSLAQKPFTIAHRAKPVRPVWETG
jgi:hypothetical protein